MTSSLRQLSWRKVALSCLLLTAGAGCWAAAAIGQDAGEESLSRQRLPWYESATGEIKAVELQPRDEPSSLDRAGVPEVQPVDNSFWDWLANLFRDWSLDGSLGTALYWLFWIGLAAGLTVLVIWIIRNVDARPASPEANSEHRRSLAQSVAQLPFQIDTADGDFRSLAARAYSDGDYRRAIVWLFSHVLVSLDQHDLIRLKKGKTNRQYLQELASSRELSAYYSDVMHPFEASFFGDHEVGSQQFQACWNGLEQFEKRLVAFAEGKA